MTEKENKALWIFKNFKETIDELPKKDQGEAWRLIINYAFDGEENIEKELTQTKKMVKMAFFSLKPLIKLRKKSGSQNGKSNNPSGLSHDTEPNIGANIGANIDQNLGYTLYNNNNNNNNNSNSKKKDPFLNPTASLFKEEYQKVFNCKPFLMKNHLEKLVELEEDMGDEFKDTIPDVVKKLKNTDFDLPSFTATYTWLLKDDNYAKVLSGAYEKKKTAWEIECENYEVDEYGN